jgi:hypothetical protein
MKRISQSEKSGASYDKYLRSTGKLPLTSKRTTNKIPMYDYIIYSEYLRDIGMLPLTTIKKGTILFHGSGVPWITFKPYTFFSLTPNLAKGFGSFMWVGILTNDVSMVDFRESTDPGFKNAFCDVIFEYDPDICTGDGVISDRKNTTGYPSLPELVESRGADGWIAKDYDDELGWLDPCTDKELKEGDDEVLLDNELVFRDPTNLKTICWLSISSLKKSPDKIYYDNIYQALLCAIEETPDMWRETDIEQILETLRGRWPCTDASELKETHNCRYWIHPRDYVDGKETESPEALIDSIQRRLGYSQTSMGILVNLVGYLREKSKDNWKYWPIIREVMIATLPYATETKTEEDIMYLFPIHLPTKTIYEDIINIPEKYRDDPFVWGAILNYPFLKNRFGERNAFKTEKGKVQHYVNEILKIAPPEYHTQIKAVMS